MSWTKQQFIEFCNKCGVDPKKALQEGKVSVRKHKPTGAIQGSIAAKQNRKKRAIKALSKVQDSFREPDQAVALEQEVYGQDEGMVSPTPSFRVSIIGLRVRPIDPDNFAAGCKGIVDGIVRARLIKDDDWKTTEVTAIQRKVSAWQKEGTLIEIQSLP